MIDFGLLFNVSSINFKTFLKKVNFVLTFLNFKELICFLIK